MARRDEDALSWDGDDDPTLDTGVPTPTEDEPADGSDHPDDSAALPEGWTAVGRGSGSVSHTGTVPAVPADAPPRPAPPVAHSNETSNETSDVTGGAVATDPAASSPADASRAPASAAEETDDDSAPLGTVALVSLGVLGGVYLLFAIGWLVGGLRLQGRYRVLVTDSMYQGALWLAAAAPLIWFATVLFATRNTRSWVRWLWLVFGVLLLIPWPFLMIGAVGR